MRNRRGRSLIYFAATLVLLLLTLFLLGCTKKRRMTVEVVEPVAEIKGFTGRPAHWILGGKAENGEWITTWSRGPVEKGAVLCVEWLGLDSNVWSVTPC